MIHLLSLKPVWCHVSSDYVFDAIPIHTLKTEYSVLSQQA